MKPKPITLLLRLPLLLLFCGRASFAAENLDVCTEPGFGLPAFQFLRQNENWKSVGELSSSTRETCVSNFKYIERSEGGPIWASFGGHLRGRIESWDDFSFGAPIEDEDQFGIGRVVLHGDVHFGDSIRVFVEVKSAFSTDRDLPGGKRPLDVDEFDLQQAFVDFRFDIGAESQLTLRVGRQALLFGSQRLVSPLPWGNALRSWDGITGSMNIKSWKVTGFWSQFAVTDKYDFNQADAGTEFFGTYASGPIGSLGNASLDVYGFGLHRDIANFNGRQGEEDRYTIGARLSGDLSDSNVDYDVETAYQFGEFGPSDISALMFATQLGYTLKALNMSPRIHVGLDYASGDDSDGDLGTFNQLFPLGHAYLGYIDAIGRQNIIAINPGISLTPAAGLTLRANAHLFWRASDDDAVYNAGGGVIRSAPEIDASKVGTEMDLTLQYAFSRASTVLIGYSRFFASDFIEDSGSDKTTDFVYVQTQFTF